jgi:hypothetical protein
MEAFLPGKGSYRLVIERERLTISAAYDLEGRYPDAVQGMGGQVRPPATGDHACDCLGPLRGPDERSRRSCAVAEQSER